MPWRDDYLQAAWVVPEWGLAGVPAHEAEEPESRPDPIQAVLFLRDRIGFRYERIVELDDYVSQREAAQLLQAPTMTINRWVRGKRIPSTTRNGFSVVRLRDVLQHAKKEGIALNTVGRLVVRTTDREDTTWVPLGEEVYGKADEEGS